MGFSLKKHADILSASLQVRLAVVGAGTGVVIEGAGEPDLPVAFTPTKVTMHLYASPQSLCPLSRQLAAAWLNRSRN